jgi:serine/threonine-protein kinase
VEYDQDALLCQVLLRRRLIHVSALTRCAEEQRAAKRAGRTPEKLEALLSRHALLSRESLDLALLEAAAKEGTPTERVARREGSSSSNGARTPEPEARERDGVSPGERLGPYEIERRLAKGGMGSVFVARDRLTGGQVALKVLAGERAKRDPDAKRFFREARLACALKHEGIVRGLGFGCDRGIRYFAMELVPGESLKHRLKREGALPEAVGVEIGRRIALALAYAHARSIVHRDVKPDNVLVSRPEEGALVVKLCDLGLAREVEDEADVTKSGVTVGTPRYISPEQARGERDVDVRSDIYSLGVTLFHVLSGQPPFPDASGMLVMSRHIFDAVPDVRSVRPDLSEAVAAVLRRMTMKKREDRHGSAAEVAAALEGVVRQRSGLRAEALVSAP